MDRMPQTIVKKVACLALWRMAQGKANTSITVSMDELADVMRGIGATVNAGQARHCLNQILSGSWAERTRPMSTDGSETLKVTAATRKQAEIAAQQLETALIPPQKRAEADENADTWARRDEVTAFVKTMEAAKANDAAIDDFQDRMFEVLARSAEVPKLRGQIRDLECQLSTMAEKVTEASTSVDPAVVEDVRSVTDVLTKLMDLAGNGSFEGDMLSKLMAAKLGFDLARLYDLRANLWSHFPEAAGV